MNYTFEKGEKNIIVLKINFDLTEWNNAQIKAYDRIKGRFNIPGFRKGHVPKNIIDKQYGKEVFYEEAFDVLFAPSYSEILKKETSIEPIDNPALDFKDNGEAGITLICDIPCVPEVKLGAYTGLTFTKDVKSVSAKDVEEELKRLQERNAREVDVTEGPCKNGNIVIIDYSGSVDGVKFEGGTAEKQRLELGSNMFIPGFEDQVVGMNIGEEKDINVTFPKEYTPALAGKDAVFHIKLHEIKNKELPEINDEFIKDAEGVETLDQYKKDTKKKFQVENEKKAERELEDAILNKIVETSETVVPDALVERDLDNIMQNMEYRLMYSGLNMDMYLEQLGKTKEEFRKSYVPQAEIDVKSQLVYAALVKELKLDATEEEIDAKIAEKAKEYNKDLEEFKKTINEQAKNRYFEEVVFDKLFAYLKANNTITDKKEAKKAAKEEAKA